MQKCSNCLSEFRHKDIIKSIWLRSYSPILCKDCNIKHYVHFSTRLILALSIGCPVFILNRFFHNIYYIILIYMLWSALVIYLTPFFARYYIKTENEESWY